MIKSQWNRQEFEQRNLVLNQVHTEVRKNEFHASEGFTLVEVIISIAVLSIMCVIFLQLFVKADQTSEKAIELDRSVRYTHSMFEVIEGIADYQDILQSDYFTDMIRITQEDGVLLQSYVDETFVQAELDHAKYLVETRFTKELRKADLGLGLFVIDTKVMKVESSEAIYEASIKVLLEDEEEK